jgi:hypothetical protein
MMTQTNGDDPNYGESYLTLGWEVTLGHDPRYWLARNSIAGAQAMEDLVQIPARLMGTHTAIIAQSGSGKSFFLGRLIEEILLQTSADCLILDPNADFRRIREPETTELWLKAKYDSLKRKGILPHEASREDFEPRWREISATIRTADGTTGLGFEPLRIWWPSLSMEFLAEDLNPMLQSDLYHCHAFIEDFGALFEFKYHQSDSPKDLLSEAQGVFELARALSKQQEKLRRTLTQEYGPDQIIREIRSKRQIDHSDEDPYVWIAEGIRVDCKAIESRAKRFIESALVVAEYVSSDVERFYFGKARQYQTAGIIQTSVQSKRWSRTQKERLNVIDLPSLREKNTRLLVINSILNEKWREARDTWRAALIRDASQDKRTPTFIVVDEAHNLIPAETQSKPALALREQFRMIVAEGRKYGLFLILVSQRPDKLDPLILSECENKAIMKLGSASVLELTTRMLGLEDLSPKLLQKCLEFETGRVLLAGSWCPDGPKIAYAAARRTVEGGRNLRPEHWLAPREIMRLTLATEAKSAAIELKKRYPQIEFARGRVSVNEQAKVMSKVLVTNHRQKTGQQNSDLLREPLQLALALPHILGIDGDSDGFVRRELREWLDTTNGPVTEEAICDRLIQLISAMSDQQRDDVNAHLTGRAFDLRPPAAEAQAIRDYINNLPWLRRFAETEDGSAIWHVQFHNHSA